MDGNPEILLKSAIRPTHGSFVLYESVNAYMFMCGFLCTLLEAMVAMACVRTISYAIIYNYDAVYIEHAARYFDILSQKEWAALIWSSVEVIGEAMSRPEVKPRVNCRHLIGYLRRCLVISYFYSV